MNQYYDPSAAAAYAQVMAAAAAGGGGGGGGGAGRGFGPGTSGQVAQPSGSHAGLKDTLFFIQEDSIST